MKKLPLMSASAVLIVLCVLYSCAERVQTGKAEQTGVGNGFSVEDAKRFFDSDITVRTRTGESGVFDETEVLTPGKMLPAWASASLYRSESLHIVDATFDAEYDYRSLQWDEEGISHLLPILRRLVVLKVPETGEMSSYQWIGIPDIGSTGTLGDESGFSGLVIYATLGGCPVSVGRFAGGTLQNEVSLKDASCPLTDNLDKMAAMLAQVYVVRRRTPVRTRGVKDDNLIEDVIVVGNAPIKLKDGSDAEIKFPELNPPKLELQYFQFGGGNGSPKPDALNGKKKSYAKKANIKYYNEKVEGALDSLANDCMGQLLIGLLNVDITIETGYFGSSSMAPWIVTKDGVVIHQEYAIEMGWRLDDISLMEELFHVFQRMKCPGTAASSLNDEVEAKLAWYMYRQRRGNIHGILGALGGSAGVPSFDNLSRLIHENNLGSPEFFDAYENAVSALRGIPAYRNEDKYPFDPGQMDFACLLELMKGCK